MLSALDSQRKGLLGADAQNWDALTRDDIYRHRVFGTDSGAGRFIDVPDKRKFTPPALVLYGVFMIVAWYYVDARIPVEQTYEVNAAVKNAVMSTSFEANPVPKTFNSITSPKEMIDWLTNAMPSVVMPTVQYFNVPVGEFRFTARRMFLVRNDDERFKVLAGDLWKGRDGIQTSLKTYDVDRKDPYGAYRDWSLNRTDLAFRSLDNTRCNDGEDIDTLELTDMQPAEVYRLCSEWCQNLVHPRPCRCFEVTGRYKCEFFFMKMQNVMTYDDMTKEDIPGIVISRLNTTHTSGGRNPDEMYPLLEYGAGVRVFWPVMKRFVYSHAPIGYDGTEGYVTHLSYITQENINLLAQSTDVTPPTLPEVVATQIQDWVLGDWLKRDVVCLAVDFMCYNMNYQVLTLVQLTFESKASGVFLPACNVQSSKLELGDVTDKFSWASELSDITTVLYLLMMAWFVLCELLEMFQRGLKYWTEAGNLLSLFSILLNCGTIATWYEYRSTMAFSSLIRPLQSLPDGADWSMPENSISAFTDQVGKLEMFTLCASATMLVMWMQFVHYLNDIFSRVNIMMNAIYRASLPVIFLVCIVGVVLLAYMYWGFLMFGMNVRDFSSTVNAISSCIKMVFGHIGTFNEVNRVNPGWGFVYFITYMLLMNLVFVNLSKAVLLAAFEDAMDAHEINQAGNRDKKRAVEFDQGGDFITKRVRRFKYALRKLAKDYTSSDEKHVEKEKEVHVFERKSIAIYLSYCVAYFAMASLQTRISFSNKMQHTVKQAILSPTFTKVHPVTFEIIEGNNFDNVDTHDETLNWLQLAVPQMMFSSSEGQNNPLKTYASSAVKYDQVVLNNENILIGQQPVRLSLSYFKMEDSEYIRGVSEHGSLARRKMGASPPTVSSAGFMPFGFEKVEAKNTSEILHTGTKKLLDEYCNYTTGYGAILPTSENAFVCMLSVNRTSVESFLSEAFDKKLVTNQTAKLVVDFVAYNGYAETFAHTAVVFGFDPNGMIRKGIVVEAIRLDSMSAPLDYVRMILEMYVICCTSVYFVVLIKNACHAVAKRRSEQSRGPSRLDGCKHFIIFFTIDPFNLLDLICCVMVMCTMGFWYSFMTYPFTSEYFFGESPVWEQCHTHPWCSDAEVITYFSIIAFVWRRFIRVCAINTLLLSFQALKFLRAEPRMFAMLRTLFSGFKDIFWFFTCYMCFSMGFVFSGHYLLGRSMEDYITIPDGFVTTLQMYYGKFDFDELTSASTFGTPYFIAYMLLFKFVLMNMFLAIVYRSFVKENMARERHEQAASKSHGGAKGHHNALASMKNMLGKFAQRKESATSVDSENEGTASRVSVKSNATAKTMATVASKSSDASAVSAVTTRQVRAELRPSATVASDDADTAAGGSHSMERLKFLASNPDALEAEWETLALPEDKKRILEEVLNESKFDKMNWKHLPLEIKEWALKESRDIFEQLMDLWVDAHPPGEHGDVEEKKKKEAEDFYSKRMLELRGQASKVKENLERQELQRLKVIHEDQESLSWYIMKRETELRKLESTREDKRLDIEKMEKAAESLIRKKEPTEDAGGAPPPT